MHKNDITEAQQQALEKAWSLLKEHFDAVLITYDTEVQEGTDRAFELCWHGGISTAIGMATRAQSRLSERCSSAEG